ncbi:MAG: hypothetical protein JWO15_3260 [Sphingomonadales bacterium]|nr:hypothetical protein [Sphingomonadales bacterium]
MTQCFRTTSIFGTLILAGFSVPAFAVGTTAGSTITNTASVAYSVGGVAQTAVSASTSFTVDRKVNLLVVETGTATTSVSPGQVVAVTTFTVTNLSNAPLDLGLSVAQQANGATAQHGGIDSLNVTTPLMYVDTNNSGAYDAGDTAITYLDELAADASKTVFIVAGIPSTAVNGDLASVVLTAQAFENGAVASQGALVTATAGANTSGKDTVFADGAGATDAANDGQYSGRDDYTVASSLLTIVKTSKLISDPVNGTTNPKMIPGAIVEYCVQANNAAGGTAATNVVITDTLPGTLAFLTSFGSFINGSVTGGACNADGTAGGSNVSGTVTATLPTVAAGSSKTLYFRATIN